MYAAGTERARRSVGRDEKFERAFRDLFQERFASLHRYLHRWTGDPGTAADVAQEAFVRLYQRGAMPRDPRAWLVTVANNLVRDLARRSARRRVLLDARSREDLEQAAPSGPMELVLDSERRAKVRRALDALPERYRQALLLRHEGYSYRDIAAALDYGVSGVGKLLVRATAAFEDAYGEADASD